MDSKEDLEKLYSPSRWSKRYSAEEVLQKHIEFVSQVSNSNRNNLPCLLDIPYGPTEKEKIDIFGTDLDDESPVFIYIHGGYWQQLNKEISNYAAASLYKHGFKVIVIGYTLCPNVTLEQITKQIQNAFLKCLEYAKSTNTRKLYVGGHSAGAHLATNLFQDFFFALPATDRDILKAVYLISGVYDLIPLISTYVNDALKLDYVNAKKLSPLHQDIQKLDNVQFFIIYGENDSPAFGEQSHLLYNKLKDGGCISKLISIKDVDHFNIVELLNDENYEIIQLIVKTANL